MVPYRCENPTLCDPLSRKKLHSLQKKKKKKKSIPSSELTALAGRTVEITVVEVPI